MDKKNVLLVKNKKNLSHRITLLNIHSIFKDDFYYVFYAVLFDIALRIALFYILSLRYAV